MGHKGVSKRKPKKSAPLSNNDSASSSKSQAGNNSPVQSLVNTNDNIPNRGGTNTTIGMSKKIRKGK